MPLQPAPTAAETGVEHLHRGLYRAAAADFTASLRCAPSARLRLLRSMALRKLGDAQGAWRDLRAAQKLEPGSWLVRLARAELVVDRGGWARALKECEAAGRLAPQAAAVHRMKAELELKLGLRRRALASLRRLIALEPREARWRLEAAGLLSSMGRPRAALQEVRAAACGDPRDPRCLELKAELEWRLGRKADSIRSIKSALRLAPGSLPLRLRAARYFSEAGQPEASLAQCRAALKLDPDCEEALGLRAGLRARRRMKAGLRLKRKSHLEAALRQFEAAAPDFGRVGKESPRRGLPLSRYEMQPWRNGAGPGPMKSSGGLPWPYFQFPVIRPRPEDRSTGGASEPSPPSPPPLDLTAAHEWEIHALAAEAHWLAGRSAGAENRLRMMARAAPDRRRGEILSWQGKLQVKQGRYRDALRTLDKTEALDCPHSRLWRGVAKLGLGRVGEAIPDLERAVAESPWDGEARLWLDEARRLKDDYLSWAANLWPLLPRQKRAPSRRRS